MPLKTKSVSIKDGTHYAVIECTLDKNVKAAPLNPKISAAIKGEALAEESKKKQGKEEEKVRKKQEGTRKKQQRKAAQQQKKRVVKENQKLVSKKDRKEA